MMRRREGRGGRRVDGRQCSLSLSHTHDIGHIVMKAILPSLVFREERTEARIS
jgi:hypothetical protein